MSNEENRVSIATQAGQDEMQKRYRFLLSFLLERRVLNQYDNGIWRLRGIYGVDDSGLKGAGRTPEEAIDNAIIAVNLDPVAADKFWSESCEKVLSALATQAPVEPQAGQMTTLGELMEASGLSHFVKDGDLAHMMIVQKFAALVKASQPAPVTVPSGFKLVPDEHNMTDEQAEAIAKIANCCGGIAYDIYRAALAAAPAPAEQSKDAEYPAIRLTRDQDGLCEVSLFIGGKFVPVMSDNGTIISHMIGATGIQDAIAAQAQGGGK